ncbi:hypothetical protein D3C72_1524310 [compost metagenome]
MMLTVVFGFSFSVAAKRSRMGRKLPLMSARLVSKEMSLGISIFRRLSAVCETCTPVPCVACSIARFWFSMRLDQILPMTAPAAAPIRAPPAVRPLLPPPVVPPIKAPRPAPTPAPVAVPRCVADMSAQPLAANAITSMPIRDLAPGPFLNVSFMDFLLVLLLGHTQELPAHVTAKCRGVPVRTHCMQRRQKGGARLHARRPCPASAPASINRAR